MRYFERSHVEGRGYTIKYTEECLDFVASILFAIVKKKNLFPVTTKDFYKFKEIARYSQSFQFRSMIVFVFKKFNLSSATMETMDMAAEIINDLQRQLLAISKETANKIQGDWYEANYHFNIHCYIVSCVFFGDKRFAERFPSASSEYKNGRDAWRSITSVDDDKLAS